MRLNELVAWKNTKAKHLTGAYVAAFCPLRYIRIVLVFIDSCHDILYMPSWAKRLAVSSLWILYDCVLQYSYYSVLNRLGMMTCNDHNVVWRRCNKAEIDRELRQFIQSAICQLRITASHCWKSMMFLIIGALTNG